jgi:glycosyltransferase involved in cell wall biosynthesis
MIDGVTMVVHNYATRLAKIADVVVFCPVNKEVHDDTQYDYKIIRSTKTIPLPRTDYRIPLPKIDLRFKRILRKYDLDIIHCHSAFGVCKQGLKYAKKRNKVSISTLHSHHKRDISDRTKSKIFIHFAMREILRTVRKSQYIYAINQATSDLWHEYGLKQVDGILRNATEMKYLDDEDLVNQLKEKYQILADEKVFISVGRLDTTKNTKFTIDVLKNLKENNFKFKMFFIGCGNYLDELTAFIKKNKLEDCVILTGRLTDRNLLAAYYKLAHLHIFPSTYDTQGLVQIEAASQKTPTIFAKGSMASSSITPETNGYVCSLDKKLFAQKIMDIFNDEANYQEVREAAYRDLYRHWDEVISDVYQMYFDKLNKQENS